MRQPALLGIDAGTSSVKVCVFSPQGEFLHKENSPVPLVSRRVGEAELDVGRYWILVCDAVRRITARNQLAVLGIGLSTTCPTIVCMDEDYQPIGNGITYLDNRAMREASVYSARFANEAEYVSIVGNRCSVSTCSASTMMWIRDNQRERWDQTRHIGMLNSYLAAQLTGQAAVDTTQASYSGLFCLANPVDWDDSLLEISGIPREKLLKLVSPCTPVGAVLPEVAAALGLPAHTVVAIGSGDTAAAAFSIGFTDPTKAFESAGTSGVLTFVTDKPRFDPLFMNRCHVIPGMWMAHGANSMMGGSVDWLRRNILTELDNEYDKLESMLEHAVPGAHGVVFLPYLSGERCPIWNPKAKGVWYGLTLQTDKIDLIESVHEAGAYSLRQIRDLGEQRLGCSIGEVVAVGNGTSSFHWCQMKADVLGVPYRTTSFADAAAYGAALMGAVAAKVFASPTDGAIPFLQPDGRTYLPTSDPTRIGQYGQGYGVYTALYPALREIMEN